MKSNTALFPSWINDLTLLLVIITAIALPAFFYHSINRSETTTLDNLNFSSSAFLAHIDSCEVKNDYVLIKGWALILEEEANTPTNVYLENSDGKLISIKSRVSPRPDVDSHFDIDYRNSAVGFTASTAITPGTVTLPTKIVLVKKSLSGETHGDTYDC